MELVYLWVEEYKNIHRQGFNFSPRFRCAYDPESNELTIDDNPDHIENFFGDNINVTAIVGKNGSGKSSIVESLNSKSFDEMLVFLHDEKLYFHSRNGIKINNLKEKKYIFENHIFLNYNTVNDHKEIAKKYLLLSYRIKKKISSMYIPFFISPEYITLYRRKDFVEEIKMKLQSYTYENLNRRIEYEKLLRDINDLDDLGRYVLFLLGILAKRGLYNSEIYNAVKRVIEKKDEKSILIIEKAINKDEKIEKYSYKDYQKILKFLGGRVTGFSEPIGKDKLYQDNLFDLVIKYNSLFDINISDKKGLRNLQDLSEGEKYLFSHFLILYESIFNNGSKSINIFLDEPDIFLHPDWQKSYIAKLIKMIKHNFGNKEINVILTTHSPFLLSDIPKQNIIFLDTYKESDEEVKKGNQKVGNCKVLKHNAVMVKEETFGANIHTLLRDSFFMENGLLGEFAKDKINKIIKYLREDKIPEPREKWVDSKENLKKTIESIGEPFLRNKVLELYYDKFTDDATKKARKEELEKQKKQIERELSRYD